MRIVSNKWDEVEMGAIRPEPIPLPSLALHGLRDHITATVRPKRKRTYSKEEIRRCAWSKRRKVVSELLSD